MSRTGRTLIVVLPAAVVIAAAWLRLEHPVTDVGRAVALVALALSPLAVARRRWRVLVAVVTLVLAVRIAFGVWLLPGLGLGSGLGTLGTRFGNGVSAFYAIHLPFDPRVETDMAALVLAGLFSFTLLVALLAAARRPVAAALALLAGAGWPATLLGPSHGIAMGTAILVAGLILLAGLGSRSLPALALPAVAVVALAAVGVGSATAARHGLVHWQTWNPTSSVTKSVSVSVVWQAQYGGLNWHGRPVTVLHVQAPRAPGYLRATVLDDFVGDAWTIGLPRSADALEPADALRPQDQTREVVTNEALADTHLVGGSVPMRYSVGGARIEQPERGFGELLAGLPRDFRYTVWSYTPRPTEAQLRASPPKYPAVLSAQGLLSVGDGVTMPPFGAPNRAIEARRIVSRTSSLYRYLPLERVAERVAGHARTPYDAVADLERFFLVDGGFRYSNHPFVASPALVNFVTTTRSGYCQFFAGAMALMLRYLGIPARVAVGFSSGTYSSESRSWVITDHDAHAWVEAWFKGYGWLPFDPTPGGPGSTRGLAPLPAGRGATAESVGSPGIFARTAGRDSRIKPLRRGKGTLSRAHLGRIHSGGTADSPSSSRGVIFLLLLVVVAAVALGIVVTKLGVRVLRRLERDPRRVAAGCRAELADYLVDQRIETARSATLHELGDFVRRRLGVDSEAFVAAATTARFGRAEDADAAARDARRELRSLLRAVSRRLTKRERLLGLFSLRSLSGRAAAGDGSAALGTTAS